MMRLTCSLLLPLTFAWLTACSSTPAPPNPAEPSGPAPAAGEDPPGTPEAEPNPHPSQVAPPAGEPASDLRARLIPLLSGYEHVPSHEELLRLGPEDEVAAELEAIYRDETLWIHRRVQALAALRYFPGPGVRALYEEVLMSPEAHDMARRSAVWAHAHAFGVSAWDLLLRLLEHPDLHTRDVAARALVDVDADEARAALRARLDVEPEEAVRLTLRSLLDEAP